MTEQVGGLFKSLFGGNSQDKAAKRSANSAAERAQGLAAQQENANLPARRQGRRRLMFNESGQLGVTSKVGAG